MHEFNAALTTERERRKDRQPATKNVLWRLRLALRLEAAAVSAASSNVRGRVAGSHGAGSACASPLAKNDPLVLA